MRFDRQQLRLHVPWAVFAALLILPLVGWTVVARFRSGEWLGGGSLPALACGIAAGLIIAMEMLLWPRKYFRRLRLIPARHWMAAHIWLGFACFPLAIFHTGFHLGGMLPKTLMILFVAAFASGVYGLILQNVIPKLALRLLPLETIYSQIDHVAAQSLDDLRRELTVRYGPMDESQRLPGVDAASTPPLRSTVLVPGVQATGLVKGRTLRTHSVSSSTQDRGILWDAFQQLQPYLAAGARGDPRLAKRATAAQFFAEVRKSCKPESQDVIGSMERCYEQRQQFDLQSKMHHWLFAWLPIHVGLSVAVFILLLIHIVTAIKFW